jgi:hypothetical protein
MNDNLWDYLVSLFDGADVDIEIIELDEDGERIYPAQFIDMAPDVPNTHYPYEYHKDWN